MDQKLIEQIVWEVIQRLSTTSNTKPHLILVYPSQTKQERILTFSSELQKYWQVETIRLESTSGSHLGDEGFNSIDTLSKPSYVFLDVDQDLLARGALGLTDTPASRLLARAFRNGNPVLLELQSDLQDWLKKPYKKIHPSTSTSSPSYWSRIYQYKKALLEYGAWFGNVMEWQPTEKHVNQKLLTEQDLMRLGSDEVRELRITSKTIVTHLARDAAKEKGIRIRVDEES